MDLQQAKFMDMETPFVLNWQVSVTTCTLQLHTTEFNFRRFNCTLFNDNISVVPSTQYFSCRDFQGISHQYVAY